MFSKTSKTSRKKAGKEHKAKRDGIKKQLQGRRFLVGLVLGALAGSLYYQHYSSQPITLPPPPTDAVYKQTDQPIEKRVDDLLERMTLEEKLGQMAMVNKDSIKKPIDISRYNLGAVLSGAGVKPDENTPAGWLNMVENIKAQAKNSRLGIPLLYGVDATHGHGNVPGSTVFPHAIGLGATDDTDLVREVAAATAAELAATGINWNFAPSLDAPQDIRWGRTYENFSHNPQLNARLGAAYVEGIQTPPQVFNGSPSVLATAKHFLAAGSMQWLSSNNKDFKIDQGKTPRRDQLLGSEYLVPFKAAVEADVSSVMVGLNFWGDERVIDSEYLITDKLKTELGFKGFVVSDWYGVYEFADVNNYSANIKAINAGLDMAMLPFDYKTFIRDVGNAVKRGAISQTRIDDAVRRILYQKFKAGLFDLATTDSNLAILGSNQHRQLARRAVAASAVLLKNESNTLPLSHQTGRILVAGSGADNVGRQSGAWTVEWQGIDGNWLPGGISVLQGIKQVARSNSVVEYEKDANFNSTSAKADVGIAVISEKPYAEGWGDNAYPTIDTADKLVINHLKEVSHKVILIIISGRPLLINEQIAQADAVVAAWLPGSQAEGLADVLFGDQPFTAKLPLSWPSNISQVPIAVNGTTADNTTPLFNRGFGLTY